MFWQKKFKNSKTLIIALLTILLSWLASQTAYSQNKNKSKVQFINYNAECTALNISQQEYNKFAEKTVIAINKHQKTYNLSP